MELTRKRDTDIEGNPSMMDSSTFSRIKRAFERLGGVIQQDDEAVRHLEAFGIDASTFNEHTVLMRPNPTRASVFEELIHTAQFRRGEMNLPEGRLDCEIRAQMQLLKYRKAYGLNDYDVMLTQHNLNGYLDEWREIYGEEWRDESD